MDEGILVCQVKCGTPVLSSMSVARSTSTTSAVDAFYDLVFLQLVPRYATYASGLEVGLLGLNASEAAKLFITLLFPLCNQIRLGVAILQQPVIELLAYGFLLVV